jgi:hypothetical protein
MNVRPFVLQGTSDAVASDDDLDPRLIERVLAEYREMPGVALTLEQARRLWGCDEVTCRRVADALLARHELRWSHDHRLIRAGEEP